MFIYQYYGYVFFTSFLLFLLSADLGEARAQTAPDSLWSLSSIRVDQNHDNNSDHLGERVTTTGIANVSSGVLHESFLQAFIQTNSAGLSIFDREIGKPFKAGDSLVVSGIIQNYNGLIEVHVDSYRVAKRGLRLPEPTPLEKALYHPEKYLGMVVEGSGKIVEKGSIYNGKYVKIAPSDTARRSMMVYVSNFHSAYKDFDFEVLSIGDELHVKGIIGEYNPDFPRERTYKLFLRTKNDLQYASLPRYYLLLILGGLILGTVIIGGWIYTLRQRVDSKTQEIKDSLKEKEILLQEIHHRVKNNLSLISGLIELQLDSTSDQNAREVLKDSQSRIHSMAMIHEKLYQTESLSDIALENYIRELVEAIHSTFTEYRESVELKFDMDHIEVDINQVIPCGLLINELVVNAFKHAFTKEKQGILEISLKEQDSTVTLSIADNGPGLPEDFTIEGSDSLGSMLINTFAAQLEADTEITNHSGNGGGARFRFRFSLDKD